MVEKWFADIKCDHKNTADVERSSHPNSAAIPENIKKDHKIILADNKLKLCEIADTVKIAESIVFTILHDHLFMRKLCSN